MVNYFDTSLLFNLYVPQATATADVIDLVGKADEVVMSEFGLAELRNAIRLCAFRGDITKAELNNSLAHIDQDVTNYYCWQDPVWKNVYLRAEAIGKQVTRDLGIRGMDLLHLAIATELNAKCFISADQRQREAAARLGMLLQPESD